MTSNDQPQVPGPLTSEDEATIKTLTTIMASAIMVQAKGTGVGITEAATFIGDDWKRRTLDLGRGEEIAEATRQFAIKIGESMNRVGGDRLRAMGIPA